MAIDRETLKKNGFPTACELTTEVMNSLSEGQNTVLSKFSEAGKKRNLLREKIWLCQTAKPNAAGLISFPDKKFLVCRDDSDREEAIGKFQEDLKGVNQIIISILNEALDCGLGDLEIIQKYCQKLNVKP